MTNRIQYIVGLCALAVICFTPSLAIYGQAASVISVDLGEDYTDFAVHHETGDLVALNDKTNSLVLIPRAQLEKKQAKPKAEIKVGLSPSSVIYKQYQDNAVFVVTSKQQSKVFVIDADKFEIIKQVETGHIGAEMLSASNNTDDPFVYVSYSGGSRGQIPTGVISLRDMKYYSNVAPGRNEIQVSADGRFAYARNYKTQTLTNTLEDEAPSFKELNTNTISSLQTTDPSGLYHCSWDKLFSVTMERQITKLPFAPSLITKSHPLFIGTSMSWRQRNAPATITLTAASYNEYQQTGRPVSLQVALPDTKMSPPKNANKLDDYRRYGRWSRLIADEKREHVVYAFRSHVSFVPLSAFEAPKEPVLNAAIKGETELIAGEQIKLEIQTHEADTQVMIVDKPAGMKVQGRKLTWTPQKDEIGHVNLLVTLKSGDFERSQVLNLQVNYPSRALPFKAGGITIDSTTKHAAIWNAAPQDQFGRPIKQADGHITANELAIIDLTTGKTLAQRKLATPVVRCTLAGEYALLWNSAGLGKIEVLNRSDLKRKDTLTLEGLPTSVRTLGEFFVVKTTTTTEIYSQKTLKLEKSFVNPGRHNFVDRNQGPWVEPADTVMVGQQLYNDKLELQWLGSVNSIGTIKPADNLRYNTTMPGNTRPINHNHNRHHHSNSGTQQLARTSLPDGTAITIDQRRTSTRLPGTSYSTTVEEIRLNYHTEEVKKQTLSRTETYAPNNQTRPTTNLAVLDNQVFILYDGRLLEWELPKQVGDEGEKQVPLSWTMQQSAFTLDPSGKTTLRHNFTGGKAPLNYQLQSIYNGVSLDKKTGVITIDNKTLLDHAVEQAMRSGYNAQRITSQQRKAWKTLGGQVLGRPIKGLPLQMRIQLSASDQDLQSRAMWYSMIIEVPEEAIVEKRRELVAAQEKAREERAALASRDTPREVDIEDAGREHQGEGGGGERKLLQRIDKLERRVDLLTRQIELLLLELQHERKQDHRDADEAEEPSEDAAGSILDTPLTVPVVDPPVVTPEPIQNR